MGRIAKLFIFSLVFLSLVVLGSVCVLAQEETQKISFQNFERDNGTEDEYFVETWNCEPNFETEIVHSGDRALRVVTFEDGGTLRINAADKEGYVDLSKTKKISIWAYDTQNSNTVEIRLKDVDGDGGSGKDGNTLWSKKGARKNKWTKIEWDLNSYPNVEDLDLNRISSIEIYEFHEGIYYFDDLEIE